MKASQGDGYIYVDLGHLPPTRLLDSHNMQAIYRLQDLPHQLSILLMPRLMPLPTPVTAPFALCVTAIFLAWLTKS